MNEMLIGIAFGVGATLLIIGMILMIVVMLKVRRTANETMEQLADISENVLPQIWEDIGRCNDELTDIIEEKSNEIFGYVDKRIDKTLNNLNKTKE
jgi:hypothetical protein